KPLPRAGFAGPPRETSDGGPLITLAPTNTAGSASQTPVADYQLRKAPTHPARALKKTSRFQRAVRDRYSPTAPNPAASNTIPRVHSDGVETPRCVRVES